MLLRLMVALTGVALLMVAFGMHFASTEYQKTQTKLPTTTVIIGPVVVLVEVASTDFERQLGLSGRNVLEDGRGMLFMFDTEGEWGIWMKDMNFPIDIIWASQDGTVVTVAKDISPDTYPQAFYPSVPARFVLEVPAGFVASHDIAKGSRLSIENANAPL